MIERLKERKREWEKGKKERRQIFQICLEISNLEDNKYVSIIMTTWIPYISMYIQL